MKSKKVAGVETQFPLAFLKLLILNHTVFAMNHFKLG